MVAGLGEVGADGCKWLDGYREGAVVGVGFSGEGGVAVVGAGDDDRGGGEAAVVDAG